jgi:CMP-N,N'-diacetyllegionaminic acid synthase
MNTLIIIPARAGSKGIPGKNIKSFAGRPLISYTIEYALKIKNSGDHIVVTSNDPEVVSIASNYINNLNIIERPDYLSTDTVGMSDVIRHAVNFSEELGLIFDKILLLQPTSPIRDTKDYSHICDLMEDMVDMVVSVRRSKQNPYFNLFEENDKGLLIKCKPGNFSCRQDCPEVFEYNGSMYLANKKALMKHGLHGMQKIRKFVMPEERSVDIDDEFDWLLAETLFLKHNVVINPKNIND